MIQNFKKFIVISLLFAIHENSAMVGPSYGSENNNNDSILTQQENSVCSQDSIYTQQEDSVHSQDSINTQPYRLHKSSETTDLVPNFVAVTYQSRYYDNSCCNKKCCKEFFCPDEDGCCPFGYILCCPIIFLACLRGTRI